MTDKGLFYLVHSERDKKNYLYEGYLFRNEKFEEKKFFRCEFTLVVNGQEINLSDNEIRSFWKVIYTRIFATTPEPTVRPPSRIAKRRP